MDHDAKADTSSSRNTGEGHSCIYLPLREPHTASGGLSSYSPAATIPSPLSVFQGKLVHLKRILRWVIH